VFALPSGGAWVLLGLRVVRDADQKRRDAHVLERLGVVGLLSRRTRR
jgi:hypothetical protein